METSLNVIDYPEPKEQKCNVFECQCSFNVDIKIYAKSKQEAEEKLETKDYDGIQLISGFEVESVEVLRNE